MNLKFRPEAEEDLEKAVFWYEINQKGLGARFLLAIDAAIQSIIRFPKAYPLVYKIFRRKMVKKFPFSILFSVEEKNITNRKHKSIIINGMSDHIHILVGLNPNDKISDLVGNIKKNSSTFINERNLFRGKFHWQDGYGAFSYGKS